MLSILCSVKRFKVIRFLVHKLQLFPRPSVCWHVCANRGLVLLAFAVSPRMEQDGISTRRPLMEQRCCLSKHEVAIPNGVSAQRRFKQFSLQGVDMPAAVVALYVAWPALLPLPHLLSFSWG